MGVRQRGDSGAADMPNQFPMFRLATLLARQLSSPIAARIKEYAKNHPQFGRAVCARVGRSYRVWELRYRLWAARLPAPAHAPAFSEREVIHVGADLLGEMIVFTLGSSIIIFEVNRQALKQEAKVLEERSRWVAILVALEELRRELALQQADLDRLRAALHAIATPSTPPTPVTPVTPVTPPTPPTPHAASVLTLPAPPPVAPAPPPSHGDRPTC